MRKNALWSIFLLLFPLTLFVTTFTSAASIHTITVLAAVGAGSGNVSPGSTQVVNHGSQAFTATPDAGSMLTELTVDGSPVDICNEENECTPTWPFSYTLTNVTADQTIQATFEAAPVTASSNHTITVLAAVGAGSGNVSPGSTQVVNHGSQAFTATPDAGSMLTELTVDGSPVDICNEENECTPTWPFSYTLTNVTADQTIQATFEAAPVTASSNHTITVLSADGAGSGNVSPGSTQVVNHGSQAFTATPDAGSMLTELTVDGSPVDICNEENECTPTWPFSYTLTNVTADQTIQATFEAAPVTASSNHTITVLAAVGAGSGNVSPGSTQVVNHGSQAFTATPDAGSMLTELTVDGSPVDICNEENECTPTWPFSYTLTNVTADQTIQATFEAAPVTASSNHTITVLAAVGAGSGNVSPGSTQVVNHGSQAFTATPDAGSMLTELTVDGSPVDICNEENECTPTWPFSYTLTNVTADQTIQATFEAAPVTASSNHTITVLAAVGAGSGNVSPGSTQVVNHGSQAFTATPDAGSMLTELTVDGSPVDICNEENECTPTWPFSYTLTNVTADQTIQATFEAAPVTASSNHTITVLAAVGAGSGNVSPGSTQVVNHGSQAFTATPDAGSMLTELTVDGSPVDICNEENECTPTWPFSYTLTNVTADQTIQATFEAAPVTASSNHTITVLAAVGAGSGNVSPGSTQVVNHGSQAFTATPDAGSMLTELTVDGSPVDICNEENECTPTWPFSYTLTNVTADQTIQATFEAAPVTASSNHTITVLAAVGAGSGNVSPGSTQVVNHGSQAFTATPDAGSMLTELTVDGSPVDICNEENECTPTWPFSYTLTNVTADQTIQATFEAAPVTASSNHTITVLAAVGAGSGNVSPGSTQVVNHGSQAFTATPDAGSMLTELTVDGSPVDICNEENECTPTWPFSYTLTNVTADQTIQATFEAAPVTASSNHTITVLAAVGAGSGNVSPGSTQVVNHGSQAFTATPDAGSMLTELTVDGSPVDICNEENECTPTWPFSYTLTNVTADQTIQATFEAAPVTASSNHTITVLAAVGAGSGNVSPGSTQVVNHGSQAFTATPDAGSMLTELTVDGSPVDICNEENECTPTWPFSYTLTNVTADQTIQATFEAAPVTASSNHTITVLAAVGAGSGNVSPGSTQVVNHGSQAFTATPDAGSMLTELTVDGSPVDICNEENECTPTWPFSYTLTNVTADQTIQATFEAAPVTASSNHTITVLAAVGAGSGNVSPGSTQVVNHGSQAFTATPDAGSMLTELTVDGSPVDICNEENECTPTWPFSYTLTNVTADQTIQATFEAAPVTASSNRTIHTISVLAVGNGSITPDPGRVVQNGSLTLTMTPDLGYELVELVADGTPVEECLVDEPDDCWVPTQYTFTNVTDSSHMIVATFVLVYLPVPVMLESDQSTYTSIQTAYDSIPLDGEGTIKVKAGEQSGNLVFDRNSDVFIEGGYDSTISNIVSYTVLYGSLNVINGSVTSANLIIR